MHQKRVLFLGGAYSQVPIIVEAKKRSWYIITCDYLPNNPGHQYSDEYFNVSTTDFDGILKVAQAVKPDFIVAYASDPAAPTAAWVSEQLGLPGNPYKSVQILAEKDLFRAFLKENGFNTPRAISVTSINDVDLIHELTLPIIIKPTDSSGSKGVTRVDNPKEIQQAIDYALRFSRNKRIIAEEFVDNTFGDIHGDGFVWNGELIFCCLGDHIYSKGGNKFNPCGTTWPSRIDRGEINQIEKEVNRLIKLSKFKSGAINIEARLNSDKQSYIMEIGPRSGGHFVPQALKYITGFDSVTATLDSFEGKPIEIPDGIVKPGAYYAIHSPKDGILKEILIDERIRPFVKEYHQYVQSGDKITSFYGANAALGVVLLQFTSLEEMEYYSTRFDKFIKVVK